MPLKPQELRNATYHGPFAKLSEQLADDVYWAVNLLIGLLHGPQGGSAKIIDSYYEGYEQFEDEFPEQNRVTRAFEKALDMEMVA